MAITVSAVTKNDIGNQFQVSGRMTFDATYDAGGEVLTAHQIGLSEIAGLIVEDSGGYAFDFIRNISGSQCLVKAYRRGAITPVGSNATTSGGTPAGTNATTVLALAAPVFEGTGLTASGQAVTTTDNQTMAINACAGMWLFAALVTTPPLLIVSNTAVDAAPAVFTVKGAATTDTGAYKVVRVAAPVFTGAALDAHGHAFTGDVAVAAALAEVAAGVNLSSLEIDFVAIGL